MTSDNSNTPKMGMLPADRFGASRPPLQSQHSSSVPSTPFQQPRDIRFHSRSPSPNRDLRNQSPRSVVSEAVGQQPGPQRSTPVVCKFEQGAEFRKRRIPYTENGEKALEPPKKEPKKALAPHEEDKLSGDMRELYDRLLPSDESEQRRAQLIKKLEKMMNDEWPGNDIKVNVFGSSGNLLSSSDSDVDICVTTSLKALESMHSLAMLLDRHGMKKIVCRASAKVPIVKCWDPELSMACDINVNNPLALENTRMIKTYVELDDRVRQLAKIIKYWSKRRILNDAAFGGTISSYTWTCMIINFLQRRDPPILPSLQKIEGKRINPDSQFADDVSALRGFGDANRETKAQLLFYFFRHYGYEFDYHEYVVSVREGRLVTRKEKSWDYSHHWDKEAQKRLCVEEPFTLNRNLGNSADEYSWSGVHTEIRRAFDLLADGQQLEKACEQYEFPLEERRDREPMFQRPVPRPAPTLRRSASQSGRANQEPGTGRSRKNNRNQSAQRLGNRRASSGASFSNQRLPGGVQSPPLDATNMDYFARQGNLHDQLFRQYQYLQAQQDALRTQLAHHAQQQQQVPSGPRAGDTTGSPHHRNGQANGAPSPRYVDAPQTAPLLPGYLYHYPARYPPSSPMQSSRPREMSTNTNPSSPSLVAAVPALRRQVHRASVTDSTSGSIRSQSQPGRSLPHPLTLQHSAHPGYDVSGPIPAQYQHVRNAQLYAQMPSGLQTMFSPLQATHPASASLEHALPKEYMGYLVGQSPQFGPQQYATTPTQLPHMTLRDPPPQRQRRVTPDLMPPVSNGRHASRSPSPLGHLRSYSTVSDLRSNAKADMLVSPTGYEAPVESTAPPPPVDIGGPLIVNGSTPAVNTQSSHQTNGFAAPVQSEIVNGSLASTKPLALRTANFNAQGVAEQPESVEHSIVSPRISPSPKAKTGPRLILSPNGTPRPMNGFTETFDEPASHPMHIAPLLSPVAELRTPSPTRAHIFDKQESPQPNGLPKAAKIANAKQFDRSENQPPTLASSNHERKNSAPNPMPMSRPTPSATLTVRDENPWQQATRKGHKKSKSTAGSRSQAMATDDDDRKGG